MLRRTLIYGLVIVAVAVLARASYAEEFEDRDYSRKEAYRMSGTRIVDSNTGESKIINGRIVLHYGDGVESVDALAIGLSRRGYDAVAIPGGTPGQVELFVGRSKPLQYVQRDIDRGILGTRAMKFFESRIGPPRKPTHKN